MAVVDGQHLERLGDLRGVCVKALFKTKDEQHSTNVGENEIGIMTIFTNIISAETHLQIGNIHIEWLKSFLRDGF